MCIAYMKSLIQIPVNSCTSCLLASSDTPSVYGILFFMKEEIWKDVPFAFGYKCSNLGRFKSSRGRREKLIKSHFGGKRYLYVCFRIDGMTKFFLAHRVIASVFIPNPFGKKTVNHKNGIKTDNEVGNLEWATMSENHKDAFKKGFRNSDGEKQSRSKLNNLQVLDIRRKYKRYIYTAPMLSKEFGVSLPAIKSIITRRTWDHI